MFNQYGMWNIDQPLNHDEVIEVAGKVRVKFVALIKGILEEI